MAPTTIQQRLTYLCEITGLNARRLALRAGLSHGYISRIQADPSRTNISAEAAEKLSFVTKVSRSWIVSGVGSPEETDVPKQPPTHPDGRRAVRETDPEWISIAKRAIELDPRLDWAIMGVGESAVTADELTAYAVLAEAERFKKSCDELDERKRLDKKARSFRKMYCGLTARESQTVKRSSSAPPKA